MSGVQQQIRYRILAFNKHIFNRLMLKFAGSAHSPFGVIGHVGRRSRRSYETPLYVQPVVGGFVIALTYGPEVDWYRNVLAAGQCIIRWHGQDYALESPRPTALNETMAAFPWVLRPILKLLGVRHALTLLMAPQAVGRPPQTVHTGHIQ